MSHLFDSGQQVEEVQESISLPGMPALSVCSISRNQRHTLAHTGECFFRRAHMWNAGHLHLCRAMAC